MGFLDQLLNKTDVDERMAAFINNKKEALDEKLRAKLTERYGETNIKGVGGDMLDGSKESYLGNLLSDQPTSDVGLGEPPVTEAPPAPVEEITEPETVEGWMQEQSVSEADPTFIEHAENTFLPHTRNGSVPDALAASQGAIEGGRNLEIDNPFGHKKGGEVLDYGNAEDNAKAYVQTVKNLFAYNKGLYHWVEESDVEGYKWLEENIDLSEHDIEDVLWHLQFTNVPENYDDAKKNPKDPVRGVPNASNKRYEGHREDPQHYIDMIHLMPEWRHYPTD